MRVFASFVAVLWLIGSAMPAQALGMQFCDDIKDDHARMACLREHISHLEETIVALGGRVAALENALEKMISTDTSYKLKSVGQDKCLGLAGEQPGLVSCEGPDSWTVMRGTPIKKPEKTSAPVADSAPGATGAPAPPPAADAAKPGDNGPNPCRGLNQDACAAKADLCAWKADKNRCGRKGG